MPLIQGIISLPFKTIWSNTNHDGYNLIQENIEQIDAIQCANWTFGPKYFLPTISE